MKELQQVLFGFLVEDVHQLGIEGELNHGLHGHVGGVDVGGGNDGNDIAFGGSQVEMQLGTHISETSILASMPSAPI